MNFILNNPLVFLTRTMWKYSGSNRPKVILYATLLSISCIIEAFDPIIIGVLLNNIQKDGVNSGNIMHHLLFLGLFMLSTLVYWAFHGSGRILENNNAFIVRANYKKYLLQGVMALPMEWHTDHHSGDTIDKIDKGTEALFSFSEDTFFVIEAIFCLVTSIAGLWYFDHVTAIISLIISVIAFVFLLLFDKKLVPGYTVVNRLENTVSAKIFDSLSNISTVVILRIQKLILDTVVEFIKKPFKQYSINSKLNELKWFSASVFGNIIIISVIGYYLYSHMVGGVILAGTIYIIFGYAERTNRTFFDFAALYNNIVRRRASVANAEELSKEFRDNLDAGEICLRKKWTELSIKDLSFSYHTESGADLHVDGINVKIKKGERIALIGESGGGKSTFLKLIRDLYHPKTLELSVDGNDLGHSFASIKDSISLVPQDPEIFATTIRENITLGVDYTDEHIEIFTDMASFSDVVKRLPRGLESSIVEKGVNLSGGEKQRLALARGLLASLDKDIVLLDEPTSSVDLQNELAIYKNIFEAFVGKTIISSVHRLHLLSSFDTIYFFKEGRIIAIGTFDELQKKSRDFKTLWKKYIKTRDKGVN